MIVTLSVLIIVFAIANIIKHFVYKEVNNEWIRGIEFASIFGNNEMTKETAKLFSDPENNEFSVYYLKYKGRFIDDGGVLYSPAEVYIKRKKNDTESNT